MRSGMTSTDNLSDAETVAVVIAPFWDALPASYPAGVRDIGAYRFYFADAEGQVTVEAYREDVEWFHGLLRMRYSPQIVTSLITGASRQWFGFARERARPADYS